MTIAINLILLLFSISSFAGELGLPPVDLRPGQFVDGQLFSVKYTPGKKQVSFLIVGKQAVDIQMSSVKPRLQFSGQSHSLKMGPDGHSFILEGTPDENAVLEVQEEGGKVDKFRIKNP